MTAWLKFPWFLPLTHCQHLPLGECAVNVAHAASLRVLTAHHFFSFLSVFFSPGPVMTISGPVSVCGLFTEFSITSVV